MTMAWCFGDEATSTSRSVLQSLRQASAIVPQIWSLEVANSLASAERRGRLTVAKSANFAQLLRSLPITVADQDRERILGPVLDLARQQSLSVYDAAYLDLALTLGLPIATNDRRLAQAAERCGVALFT